MARARPASLALLAVFAVLAHSTSAQSGRDCGAEGQACCCTATNWQAPRCCATGLQCTMFAGQGFGTPANISALCIPREPKGCGSEGAPCCPSTNPNGFITSTCSSGLTCTPGSTPIGSRAQYDRLSGGLAAAARDTSVSGTCKKATTCNTAYNPCGKAAGCGSAACPSGFYCASSADSGVGDVCLQLPANAGKVGGPCLPNNMPDAPMVSVKALGDVQVAAPFCSGSAVCFTPIGGDTTGFHFDKAAGARDFASRISGTRCVEVPADCGTAVGKTCCPSAGNMVTDKALPTAAWGGNVCDPAGSEHGTYCEGSYAVLGDQPLGKCAANPACGAPGQPCCRYSRANMAGVSCPRLGRPGAGYCNLANKCALCPKIAYTIEDILRCY